MCSSGCAAALILSRHLPVLPLLRLQADGTPVGGLATWLRMSSHLSKPGDAPAEPPSPSDSEGSSASGGRTRTAAVLDFNALDKPKPVAKPVLVSAPAEAAAAPPPAAKPAVPAADATAGPAQPAPAVAASPDGARGGSRLLRALLVLLLLAGLLLAGPLALQAYAPALAQRFMPSKLHCLVKPFFFCGHVILDHDLQAYCSASHSCL